ncbi:hypothetical protein BDF20DRAFT_864001 [Mycotypha africana]|uniref:uncharacterized protein n=1 Tax=Mycotypha africana TaxID=64632 RepID=UPI002301147B|nr:uncharacterized protein BDF20DRAFT_864001 [Mycotypha africana]KAI8981920.1 hypothetical protein BDF20DRAFT_864001 [Mycotypha africana]
MSGKRPNPSSGDAEPSSVSTQPSRPPLKKRFTSTFNIQQRQQQQQQLQQQQEEAAEAARQNMQQLQSQVLPTTSVSTVSIETPDLRSPQIRSDSRIDLTQLNVKEHSKDELLKRMRIAKEDAKELEKHYDLIKEKYFDKEAQQSLYRIEWGLIQAEILFIAKILIAVDITPPPDFPFKQLTLEQQRDWNYRNQTVLKELGTKALSVLETWCQQAESTDRKFRQETDLHLKQLLVSDWLKSEIDSLHSAYQRGQQVVTELEQGVHSLLEQTNLVKGNIQLVTTEVESSVERLEACISELAAVCKRQDRNQSKLVQALMNGELGDTVNQQQQQQQQPTNHTASPTVDSEQSETVPATTSAAESVQPPSTTDDQAIKAQLEEHKLIISTREKEFDDLKRDRQLLLREEERLVGMFMMTEDRLAETEYVKTLRLSIEHYRDRCYHLEQKRGELEKEIDKISASRQQMIEQVKSEKVAQGMTIESEMKRLEGDLNRIKGQRDHFQVLVEDQKMKENRENEAQEKIQSLAEQGKQRVDMLKARIEKLREEEKLANPFQEEAKIFTELKDNINHVQMLLSSLQLLESQTAPELRESTLALEKQIEQWKSNPLLRSYDSVLEETKKSQLVIDFLESNESQLLEEIDRVARIYNKLEEQQNKKVFDLAPKRDQALKLQAEKSKYAQTFPSLLAAKEKQIAAVASLRLTKEKQQDLIRQLMDKEKPLEYQVYEKEKEVRKLKKTIEEDRIDLEDINHLCDDYRISIEQNEALLAELQRMLQEKTEQFEEEQRLQEQMEEDYDKLKRKWDRISQGENPAEQQLIDECEELRALLKCSTCRQRFRTHILDRCMHTFCKNCIDARLETRQRRCPTCGEPFGASNVKNFYL